LADVIRDHYKDLDQLAEAIRTGSEPSQTSSRALRRYRLSPLAEPGDSTAPTETPRSARRATSARPKRKAPSPAPGEDAAVRSIREAAEQIDQSVLPILGAASPTDDDIAVAQAQLSGSLARAALTMGELQEHLEGVGDAAGGVLRRLIDWLLDHVVRVLNKAKGALRVDSWTIGVSGGFPAGVNVSVSVTFK